MKKIFKFFPMALASVALASCSSDDLQLANNGEEMQFEKGKLYVQVEGNDQTRGGFASAVYENASGVNSLFNALYFEKDDRIKVYCDESNWRSQVWKLGEDQQYLKKNGVASFEPEDGTDKYVQDSEVAYGIFPYANTTIGTETDKDAQYGWFANEDRTSMEFLFRDQASIAYSAKEIDYQKTSGGSFTGETVKGNFYKTPFPLWGVKAAGAKVMTMKYLTGILRVDFVAPEAPAANKANYLVIVADKQINGSFKANTNPEKLGDAAPELVGAATASDYSVNEEVVTAAGSVKNNVILVKLDNAAGHKLVYLPLPAQTYTVLDVYYLSGHDDNTAITLGTTLIDANKICDAVATSLINTENEAQKVEGATANTVATGTWYRVVDDSQNKNTVAKTPFDVAKGIMDADKVAYRDFTLNFVKPIEVKNNDSSTQNFWLDFTDSEYLMNGGEGYELNHNVTANLTLKTSGDANGVKTKLYIKTKGLKGAASGKTLTLNITNDASPIDTIYVDANLKDNLVLKTSSGQLPVIRNMSTITKSGDKQMSGLTIKSGSLKVFAHGEMNIDMPWGNKVNNLYLGSGLEKINILNGQIGTIRLNNTHKDWYPNKEAITVYTEGRTEISGFDYTTMPSVVNASGKKVDATVVKFESKLTSTYDVTNKTAAITGASGITKAILTASQLYIAELTAEGQVAIGTFDANGKQPIKNSTLKQNFTGYAKIARDEVAATATPGSAHGDGSMTIKNIVAANGLFATIEAASTPADILVNNIDFAGVNTITGTANASQIGLLAGTINNPGQKVTIQKVKVNGTNTISAPGKSEAIGGVIGKVLTESKLVGVIVNNTTTVEGQKYVGGIIGEVAAKTFVGDNTNTNLCTFGGNMTKLITHKVGTATYSENFAKKGTIIGGVTKASTDGDVKVYLAAAPTKTVAGIQAPDALWVSLDGGETYKHQLKTYYNEIGLSGIKGADAANAPAFDNTNFVTGGIQFVWFTNNWTSTVTRKFVFSTDIIADNEPADVTTGSTKYYLNWVCKTPMPE